MCVSGPEHFLITCSISRTVIEYGKGFLAQGESLVNLPTDGSTSAAVILDLESSPPCSVGVIY